MSILITSPEVEYNPVVADDMRVCVDHGEIDYYVSRIFIDPVRRLHVCQDVLGDFLIVKEGRLVPSGDGQFDAVVVCSSPTNTHTHTVCRNQNA